MVSFRFSIVALVFLALPAWVLASGGTGLLGFEPPLPPHQFYGTVTDSLGANIADGVLVHVYAAGTNSELATTSVSGGRYGYAPALFFVDAPNFPLYDFYVGNRLVQSDVPFQSGALTQLPLVVPASGSCTEDWQCVSWSSCAYVGPNPGDGIQTRTCTDVNSCGTFDLQPPLQQACDPRCFENWVCTPWTMCFQGNQGRTCTDANSCGTEVNKPEESQNCAPAPAPVQPGNPANFLELQCPVLAPSELTEIRLQCVIGGLPCNPASPDFPSVNANFVRAEPPFFYYSVFVIQNGAYDITASSSVLGSAKCTIHKVSSSAALTVPDFPLPLLALLLPLALLVLRRSRHKR